MIVACYLTLCLISANKQIRQQAVDVVGQFRGRRGPQPDHVERNAFLFFLLSSIVRPYRPDEDHSLTRPVHPSRGTDDALNLPRCPVTQAVHSSGQLQRSVVSQTNTSRLRHAKVRSDRITLTHRGEKPRETTGDQRRGPPGVRGLMATDSKSSLRGESMPSSVHAQWVTDTWLRNQRRWCDCPPLSGICGGEKIDTCSTNLIRRAHSNSALQ